MWVLVLIYGQVALMSSIVNAIYLILSSQLSQSALKYILTAAG
ncbi:unnamed protein product [marine sediment metagenome]|uniref:Uncharacterized protein n=1 Tax=marine sediment metagenome TaxID=412755 RepID=X1T0X0_9ZZZZ